jgi:hypothetical protein
MTAIWRNDGQGWSLLAPVGFPNEAALHRLVEQAPQLLPLAGTPRLTVLGKEVPLGNGYADLLAVESTGRLAVIEIKLAENSEARRAVIAQVLAYAAFLRGEDLDSIHRKIGQQLGARGHATIADAVESEQQDEPFDATAFNEGLARSLFEGRFRLVLVLDEVPDELVRLVGYLAYISEKVLIDLVTVSSYEIGGSQILVPQRIDPEYQQPVAEAVPFAPESARKGVLADGPQDFEAAIASAKPEHQANLQRLTEWAKQLDAEGLVKLATFHTKDGLLTLLPRLKAENVGLVTIWSDANGGYLQFWRTVFERRSREEIAGVEAAMGGPLKQGNITREITDGLLAALTDAYRVAAAGRVE